MPTNRTDQHQFAPRSCIAARSNVSLIALKQAQELVGGTAEQFLQLFRDDYFKYER